MSLVRPFPARVVRSEKAASVVSALAELPEDGTPAASEPDPSAYDDAEPALYVYRQTRDGASYVGIVAEVATRAFVAGRVRGHEAVQPRRVESLVAHHVTHPDAPPALVALLHDAGPAFAAAVSDARATAPLVDFEGPDGLHQSVWRIEDPGPLSEELGAAVLYVADGHHRVAAALAEWSAAGEPADTALLCVVHAMDGLHLSAFHRRVPGPVSLPLIQLEAVASFPPPTPGCTGVYADGAWSVLDLSASDLDLDVSVLQRRVLDHLDRPVEIAPAHASIASLASACDADGGVLFTLAPPPLTTLTRLADAGEVMPPKTTFFEPKPCSGIFLRR